jgi:hypothetical protein
MASFGEVPQKNTTEEEKPKNEKPVDEVDTSYLDFVEGGFVKDPAVVAEQAARVVEDTAKADVLEAQIKNGEIGIETGESVDKVEKKGISLEKQENLDAQKLERAKRNIADGKLFYAALENADEVFTAARTEAANVDERMAELKLNEYSIDVQEGKREPDSSYEESWKRAATPMSDQERAQINKDTLERYKTTIREDLGGYVGAGKSINKAGLMVALENRYKGYLKEGRSVDNIPTADVLRLRGIGLAALETGNLYDAKIALGFAEKYLPMTPQELGESGLKIALDKMKPEERTKFLQELESRKQYA